MEASVTHEGLEYGSDFEAKLLGALFGCGAVATFLALSGEVEGLPAASFLLLLGFVLGSIRRRVRITPEGITETTQFMLRRRIAHTPVEDLTSVTATYRIRRHINQFDLSVRRQTGNDLHVSTFEERSWRHLETDGQRIAATLGIPFDPDLFTERQRREWDYTRPKRRKRALLTVGAGMASALVAGYVFWAMRDEAAPLRDWIIGWGNPPQRGGLATGDGVALGFGVVAVALAGMGMATYYTLKE